MNTDSHYPEFHDDRKYMRRISYVYAPLGLGIFVWAIINMVNGSSFDSGVVIGIWLMISSYLAIKLTSTDERDIPDELENKVHNFMASSAVGFAVTGFFGGLILGNGVGFRVYCALMVVFFLVTGIPYALKSYRFAKKFKELSLRNDIIQEHGHNVRIYVK